MKEARNRKDYVYSIFINTRWMDNDIYGHVNNVTYYSYFDTVVNQYLIERGGLDIHTAKIVGFVVASNCEYYSPLAFPEKIEVCFRVNNIGSKSVEYGVAIFGDARELASAAGTFTHVFVERASAKSSTIPEQIRQALERALVQ